MNRLFPIILISRPVLVALIMVGMVLSALSSRGATINAASPSLSDVSAAITLASNGDTIAIPAGTNTWNSTLTVNKYLTIQGTGTNSTRIIVNVPNAGGNGALCGLLLQGNGTNIVTGITFQGATLLNAWPAVTCWAGPTLRIYSCQFTNCRTGVMIAGPFGVIDHNSFRNCHNGTQVLGWNQGCLNWTSYYPIAFTSLNYLFLEDNNYTIDAFMDGSVGNTHVIASAGQGDSYVARHNTVTISGNRQLTPAFDWHGDANDGTRGSLSVQIYDNVFNLTTTDAAIDKFCDARGGQALIYSNTVTCVPGFGGRGICVSEEWPSGTAACGLTVFDSVTNQWQWANTINGVAMTTFCDSDTSPAVCATLDYHNAAYSGAFTQAYPYPMVSPGLPDQPINALPVNGATGVVLTPVLAASPYFDGTGSPQSAAEWLVTKGGATVWDSTQGAVTNTTVGITLTNNVTYAYSVRYKGATAWSAWSTPTAFTTVLGAPAQPFNITPVNGAGNVPLTTMLQGSTYFDPQSLPQLASQWLIVQGATTNWVQTKVGAGTATFVPGGVLQNSSAYEWSVRYQNSVGLWSPWSVFTAFVTTNPPTPPPSPTNSNTVLIIINPQSVILNGGVIVTNH